MDIPVAETLARWRAAGVASALARVVATGGSAPLAPGTAMAVSATGEVVGGVSGGCVDAAVYTLCEQVIVDGGPALARFGPDLRRIARGVRRTPRPRATAGPRAPR